MVGMVLASSELKQLWLKELEIMRLRLADVRVKFSKGLAERISNRDFSFIQKQRGMFSYSGLSKEVIHKLRDEYHIYALDSGRICVGALNDSNLDYVCDAINKAL